MGNHRGPFFTTIKNKKNLLINGSFEDSLYGWMDPDDVWSAVMEAGTSITYTASHGQFFAWPDQKSIKKVKSVRIFL